MRELEITDAIFGGEFDGELDEIIEAVKQRRKVLTAKKARALKVGDKVRFNDQASPKYLFGQLATVTHPARAGAQSVQVQLDEAVGKFSGNHPLRCPVAIINPVEEGD